MVLWALAALCGCEAVTSPFPSDQYVPVAPRPEYALWWDLVQQCAGRKGSFDRLRFVVPRSGAVVVDGREYDGYWWEDGNRIAVRNVADGPTVRHEMLHALLQRGDHPASAFEDMCNGIVANTDVGLAPTTSELGSVPTVDAGSVLSVDVAMYPSVLSVARYNGTVAVVVTATNTTGRPSWVSVPGDLLAAAYLGDEGLGSGRFTTVSRVYFAPGQQRRVVLDGVLTTTGRIAVNATYLGVDSPRRAFDVFP